MSDSGNSAREAVVRGVHQAQELCGQRLIAGDDLVQIGGGRLGVVERVHHPDDHRRERGQVLQFVFDNAEQSLLLNFEVGGCAHAWESSLTRILPLNPSKAAIIVTS